MSSLVTDMQQKHSQCHPHTQVDQQVVCVKFRVIWFICKIYALFSSRQYSIIVINCIVPSIIIIYLLCLTKFDFICSHGYLPFF